MEFNFYSSLVMAGIVQGFFLSFFILLFTKHRTRASIYLGLLILCITLSLFQELLWEIDFVTNLEYYILYLPYSFAEAALFYFFVMTFLYPERTNTKLEKLLYLPLILLFIFSLFSKPALLWLEEEHPLRMSVYAVLDFIDWYGDFLSIIMTCFVLIVLWIEINKYQNAPVSYQSETVKSKLKWLKVLFILLFIFIALWIVGTFWGVFINHKEYPTYLILIGISIVIYILGYIGTRKIEVQEERKKIRKFVNHSTNYSIVEKSKNPLTETFENSVKNNKRYLDPNLSLENLSEELNVSRSHLSRIINNELDTSFSDYVNALRVEEAKRYLQNPDFSNYTIVAIGLEAGFNSKTTFNSAFKKFTGKTPSKFKNDLQN